jgi:exodeoxyribonuclease V alpha subunit
MSTGVPPPSDPCDARSVSAASPLLAQFNRAGVLAPADVHVAERLAALCGERDESVMLACALAVRAPRLGHVFVDLAAVSDSLAVEREVEVDLAALPWPSAERWRAAVAASPLCAVGEDEQDLAPLRLIETRLYLERYWSEERRLAADLRRLSAEAIDGVDEERLAAGLARLFPAADGDARDGEAPRPALAGATVALRRLAVIAGGPGTGKTTTVARAVALLAELAEARGEPPPRVALVAPTGKAATRLAEALHQEAAALAVSARVRQLMRGLEARTLHRLLGSRPGGGFRHDRSRPLPHDVVVVDETSMVSLSLMARLTHALRPRARLVLVGDPGQLASIEAGAVLADIVGPAARRPLIGREARARLARSVRAPVAADDPPAGVRIGDGIVVLERVHRFGGAIAELAGAVRDGDEARVIELLRRSPEGVAWIPVAGGGQERSESLGALRDAALHAARRIAQAAERGEATDALRALGGFRLLCAHRHGPHGAATWNARIAGWLAAERDGAAAREPWYVGRPLLVTSNDYDLGLFNGDLGVIVGSEEGPPLAAFQRGEEIVRYSPSRLGAVETVHAMTIHKSQGSQFHTAAVLLPDPSSRILSRELLYTAITRAQQRLILAGSEQAIRAALGRSAARASGLRARLWEPAE